MRDAGVMLDPPNAPKGMIGTHYEAYRYEKMLNVMQKDPELVAWLIRWDALRQRGGLLVNQGNLAGIALDNGHDRLVDQYGQFIDEGNDGNYINGRSR